MVIGLIMTVFSIVQYRKFKQRSRLMFSGFWAFIVLETITNMSLLFIPAIIFLGFGLYYKFIVKDSWMKEARTFLAEQDVTDKDIEQTGRDIKKEKGT